MNTFAFIFARGGSKGLPGKNIRYLNGKPLLAYSIEMAQQVDRISRVFVSSDDGDIINVAIDYGAEVIERPKELAQDDTPEWLAWKHAVKWVKEQGNEFDCFISLPTTSPLRNAEDVNACLERLDEETDIVVTVTNTSRSPYFNMVREENDYMKLLIEDNKNYSRRQDTPKAYDMSTVAYVARPEFILNSNKIFDGRVKAVQIPNERAIDIDTKMDFLVAETLLKEMKGN